MAESGEVGKMIFYMAMKLSKAEDAPDVLQLIFTF